MKFLSFLLLAIGAFVLWLGISHMRQQDRMLHDFTPTPATVISADAPGFSARRAANYLPRIRYRFVAGGKTIESSRIWPDPQPTDLAETDRLMHDYAAGNVVTAYVNPGDPSDVLLIRQFSSESFWITAAGVLLVGIGLGRFLEITAPIRSEMKFVVDERTGWKRLLPSRSLAQRSRESGFFLLATGVPLALLAGRIAMVSKPLTLGGWWFIGLAGVMLVFQIFRAIRARSVNHAIGDARLLLESVPIRRGEPFALRVQVEARTDFKLTQLRVRLVCRQRILMHVGRRTMIATRVQGEQVVELTGQTRVPAGKTLAAAGEATLDPTAWPATGHAQYAMYPSIHWEVRVEIAGNTRYAGVFPVAVI